MTLMAHAIWVGSRNIGLRYFALCIGDKAMKGRPLPRQRKTPKEMEISAYRYGVSFSHNSVDMVVIVCCCCKGLYSALSSTRVLELPHVFTSLEMGIMHNA